MLDDDDDTAQIAYEDYEFYSEGTVRAAKEAGTNYISTAEADRLLAEWRQAARYEDVSRNSDKIILSLFDESGVWSGPWVEAGYDVIQVDIQNGVDINDFCVEFLFDNGIDRADGILAACPCTDFAASGARWWEGKDANGQTANSVELVNQTLRTIELFRPELFWVIENPVGRIREMTGLPEPHLIFDPSHYGDPYTKKTMLYGKFNADLPFANVEPTEGSRIHKLSGNSAKGKKLRSETPDGFSNAFFMANSFQQQELRLAQTMGATSEKQEYKKQWLTGFGPKG
jgi:hypothetical protein